MAGLFILPKLAVIVLFCASFFVSHCDSSVTSKEELILVQILYRHGDRSAVNGYPKNPYNESQWPQGYGQLTKKGMQQHYALGQHFRQRYMEDVNDGHYSFLSYNYSRYETQVRSTDYDRTLMSAMCDLAGLYPVDNMTEWHEGIHWQPIPVHTVDKQRDSLLKMDTSCPRAEQLFNETLQSDFVKKIDEKNKEFYNFIMEKTGLQNVSIDNIWRIYDSLFCESNHPELGFTLPSWANESFGSETVFERLSRLDTVHFDLEFGKDELIRLRGGSLLKEMTENMKAKANDSMDPPQRKLFIYSAHDTTVSVLGRALKVLNATFKAPTYASAFMVELFKTDDKYFVKVFYNTVANKKEFDPQQMEIQGCDSPCSLEQFINITKGFVPTDLAEECKIPDKNIIKNHELLIAIVVSVAGLLLIVIVVVIIVCRKKRNAAYYRYTGLDEDA